MSYVEDLELKIEELTYKLNLTETKLDGYEPIKMVNSFLLHYYLTFESLYDINFDGNEQLFDDEVNDTGDEFYNFILKYQKVIREPKLQIVYNRFKNALCDRAKEINDTQI